MMFTFSVKVNIVVKTTTHIKKNSNKEKATKHNENHIFYVKRKKSTVTILINGDNKPHSSKDLSM